MKPPRKVAREIAGQITPYSIKLRVIDKMNIHASSEDNRLEPQLITFEDEEGAKLKSILYNKHLEVLEDALDDGMEYEISNVEVDVLTVETPASPEKPVYHIYFKSETTIQPIYDPDYSCLPEYILLASIPREASLGHRYDVLGIVLYVGPKYQLPTHIGQPQEACEVIIIDHSSEQVMPIIVQGEPAINAYSTLQSMALSFPVIGFTALRKSLKKGFSLETTYLTFTDLDPQDDAAASLRIWGRANLNLLTAKLQQICGPCCPQTHRNLTTIQDLLQKKEGRHWLQVQLKEFDYKKLWLYPGCSHCEAITNEEIGVAYTCNGCSRGNTISAPRVAIKFEASDETGDYFFTAFTKNAEILLEVDATTLYKMLPQEQTDYLGQAENHITSNPIFIEVAPAKSLSESGVLEWFLKQVSLT